jgi:hypothetical protein
MVDNPIPSSSTTELHCSNPLAVQPYHILSALVPWEILHFRVGRPCRARGPSDSDLPTPALAQLCCFLRVSLSLALHAAEGVLLGSSRTCVVQAPYLTHVSYCQDAGGRKTMGS